MSKRGPVLVIKSRRSTFDWINKIRCDPGGILRVRFHFFKWFNKIQSDFDNVLQKGKFSSQVLPELIMSQFIELKYRPSLFFQATLNFSSGPFFYGWRKWVYPSGLATRHCGPMIQKGERILDCPTVNV